MAKMVNEAAILAHIFRPVAAALEAAGGSITVPIRLCFQPEASTEGMQVMAAGHALLSMPQPGNVVITPTTRLKGGKTPEAGTVHIQVDLSEFPSFSPGWLDITDLWVGNEAAIVELPESSLMTKVRVF